MKNIIKPAIIFGIGSIILSSCTNQRYAATETDDIYFSASDRFNETNNEFSAVTEVDGRSYSDEKDYNNQSDESGYFLKGTSKSTDANPNAENAYVNQSAQSAQSNSSSNEDYYEPDNGTTVNNFYGNTTYYEEGGYLDDSYAARVRRFSTVNYSMGYGYYDPFFMDPFWNYGWSYWDPYPRAGWSVGWNSWAGWNVGFNYGWGSYWGPSWRYRNMWGYGGFYDPYFYGGWGYPYGGSYWHGYQHGYADGWYGSNWSSRNSNSRGIYNGRRNMATGTGLVTTNRASSSPNSGAQEKTTNQAKSGASGTASPNQRASSLPVDRLNNSSRVYQANAETRANVNSAAKSGVTKSDINPNSATASNRYSDVSKPVTVQSKNKYQSGTLSRAQSQSARYSEATESRVRTGSVSARPETGMREDRHQTTPTSRNSGQSGYTVPRDNGTSSTRYYTPSNRTKARPDNRSTPPDNRYTRPPQPRENRPAVVPKQNSRSVSPSRTPQRSVSPPNQSPRSYSPPSRGSSSPQRSFGAPSRSSAPAGRSMPSPNGGRRR